MAIIFDILPRNLIFGDRKRLVIALPLNLVFYRHANVMSFDDAPPGHNLMRQCTDYEQE